MSEDEQGIQDDIAAEAVEAPADAGEPSSEDAVSAAEPVNPAE